MEVDDVLADEVVELGLGILCPVGVEVDALAVAEVFRNTGKGFVDRAVVGPHNYSQSKELAERGAARVANFFEDFNQQLASNEYVAGDNYSMADITTLVTCDFAKWIKTEIPKECVHLRRLYEKVSARPAVVANP